MKVIRNQDFQMRKPAMKDVQKSGNGSGAAGKASKDSRTRNEPR